MVYVISAHFHPKSLENGTGRGSPAEIRFFASVKFEGGASFVDQTYLVDSQCEPQAPSKSAKNVGELGVNPGSKQSCPPNSPSGSERNPLIM